MAHENDIDHQNYLFDDGFTIIEVVIACVLMIVIFGISVTALGRAFEGSDDARETQKLQVQFDQAREMLMQDVRGARAPQRDYDLLRDRMEFRRGIQTGKSAYPSTWDIQDVKVAQPTVLTFVSDVYSDAAGGTFVGPDCVSWRLRTSGSGLTSAWMLERGVARYHSGCSTAGLFQWSTWIGPMRVGTASGALATVPKEIFTNYRLSCKTATNASCPGPAKKTSCETPTTMKSVNNTVAQNWITSVDLDFGSLSIRGKSASKDRLQSTISFRNRLSDDYLYALGCRS